MTFRVEGGLAVAAGGTVRFILRHTGGWGWASHWAILTAWLVRLRQIYGGAKLDSNLDLIGIVNSFMVDCAHMRDVLELDDSVPVGKPEVEAAVKASDALAICVDYANTWKHYLRPTSAHRVASIWEDGDHRTVGYFATIAYGPRDADPEQDHQKIDALELAEQAYAAWQALMKEHGIGEAAGLTEPILARSTDGTPEG